MKATALALALFGATAMAQEKWTTETTVDDFDDSKTVVATSPATFGSPHKSSVLAVRCTDGELDVFAGYEYLNRRSDGGASILAKFGSEAPKEIQVAKTQNNEGLFLHRKAGTSVWKDNEGAFIMASRLADATAFATRFDYHRVDAVTIKYDMAGAKEAIGEVLEACGYKPEPQPEGGNDTQGAQGKTLYGATAMVQGQWTVHIEIDDFDDSATVAATLEKDADTKIAVVCDGGDERLALAINQSESMRDSDSEEIAVRFGDEEPEMISAAVYANAFTLTSNEDRNKEHGTHDSAELARKFMRHGKFRLRYEGVTLVFDYDIGNAKEAIGKVLETCDATEPALRQPSKTKNSGPCWLLRDSQARFECRQAKKTSASATFDPSEVAFIKEQGTNTIAGSALIRQRGGVPAMTCAGNEVSLIPRPYCCRFFAETRWLERRGSRSWRLPPCRRP